MKYFHPAVGPVKTWINPGQHCRMKNMVKGPGPDKISENKVIMTIRHNF